MSNYESFFAGDFAGRCHELLEAFWNPARAQDREVTFLVAVASAGLVIPYERISSRPKQPKLDRSQFAKEIQELQSALARPIRDSKLVADNRERWTMGLLRSAEGMPDEWPEFSHRQPIEPKTPVQELVSWLRHGLAHGNISTNAAGHAIDEIVFTCGYTDSTPPLRFVSVAPNDLKRFLGNWFILLSSLQLPPRVVGGILDECAVA